MMEILYFDLTKIFEFVFIKCTKQIVFIFSFSFSFPSFPFLLFVCYFLALIKSQSYNDTVFKIVHTRQNCGLHAILQNRTIHCLFSKAYKSIY